MYNLVIPDPVGTIHGHHELPSPTYWWHKSIQVLRKDGVNAEPTDITQCCFPESWAKILLLIDKALTSREEVAHQLWGCIILDVQSHTSEKFAHRVQLFA